MDMEKLKQWMDIAKNMHGGEFWNNIFDQEFAKQFMNEQPINTSTADGQIGRAEKPKPFPLIDILEGKEEVVVVIELPGVSKENMELGLAGNILTVKGKVNPVHPHLNIRHSERYIGDFQRQIPLPDTVSPTQLSAKFWNGLLYVSYQRKVEKGEIIPIE